MEIYELWFIVLILALIGAYPVGLMFSRGFYRGKLEFISRILKNSCKKEGS